ncbi:MAG: hypothetical protein U5L07_07690 [Desulfobacterales bacterium]|nr:hypothetical protein [Desulfobacterales bacterium]
MQVTEINSKRKKRFSEFADEPKILDGAKARIDDILNQEIEFIGSKIAESKFSKNKSGKCLTLQFIDPKTGERRVVFTGSDVLINQLEKYHEKLPFLATIKRVDRYYLLT